MMISSRLRQVVSKSAPQTLILRVCIVGTNFAIMVGLAAYLGLDLFGQLAFLWGCTLVAGTVLSLGGPLILLRGLTDGNGMGLWAVLGYCLLYPSLVASALLGPLTWYGPDLSFEAIAFGGLAVNLLFCLASVLRALGSIQVSMAVRDVGPQVALGLAAMSTAGADGATIIAAAAIMMTFGGGVAIWCWRHRQRIAIGSETVQPTWSVALYGTSILGMVLSQMDLIIGGMVLPAEAMGLYALLRRIANLVALPVSVATWVSSAPISAAYGTNDPQGLQRASAEGNQIAFYPGFLLLILGFFALPLVSFLAPYDLRTAAGFVFAVLLFGAFGQVIFASGYTVATLCRRAEYAVLARSCVVISYLLVALMAGDGLTIVSNAFAYVSATTFGGVALWWHLHRELNIDTSAFALRDRKEDQWLSL